MTEKKCHRCGSPVHQAGPNKGQCTNPDCKAEHSVINSMPPEGLSDAEYKDFYG